MQTELVQPDDTKQVLYDAVEFWKQRRQKQLNLT